MSNKRSRQILHRQQISRQANNKKWKYQLVSLSRQLRAAINNENGSLQSYIKILGVLNDCYNRLRGFLDIVEWWTIQPVYNKLDRDIGMLEDGFEADCIDRLRDVGYNSEDPILECINANLHEFYAICHDHKIWISTPLNMGIK